MGIMRAKTAEMAGCLTKKALQLSGRDGSSLPGKVAMELDPKVLSSLAKNYRVIMVTGTNGKTLTTALITAILTKHFETVVTNPSGANMIQGIASCFLAAPRKKGTKVAVLEVDEASLKHVTALIPPEVIVFTNVFRDQMDRYGEIYSTYEKMLEGARLAPGATIIANGDAPIFHEVPLRNSVVYYGFDHRPDGDFAAHYNTDGVLCPKCENILRYRHITYSNLGKYYCPHCDFARRRLSHAITALEELSTDRSVFQIDGVRFMLPIAGMYNIYNALAAYAVARHFDIEPEAIRAGMESAKKVFGRQEKIQVGSKEVVINLIKNPVGFNQVVEWLALEKEPFSLVALLNDRPADGTDVSWIWDGDFERLVMLTEGRPVVLSGIRLADLSMRFEVAGLVDAERLAEPSLEALAARIEALPTRKVHVLATYTALLDLRKTLAQQGYMKGGMA